MATDLILKASVIITMDEAAPRVEAIAVDTSTGQITAVGNLAEVQAAAPGITVTDLGSTVLMPGFIDPHSHPILAGVSTQEPAHWIAPYLGYPTYADVQAFWKKLDAELPAGEAVLCTGLDRMLQGAPELTNTDLDAFFPSRPAAILDNSGHEAYFNSIVIQQNGWTDGKPPADPVGARYGRNADGTSNGRAYETAALLGALGKLLATQIGHPLLSAARWYQLMAQNGITMTSDHAYSSKLLKAYEALASVEGVPLRVGLYQMSIDDDCGDPLNSSVPETLLWKNGIKLWADGSPWVGTIATSFPYLDTPVVRTAQIPLGPSGETMMNYTRVQLDAVLAQHAKDGWQYAFHVNGDIGIDIVLDAYERALAVNGLLGTDHRWRIEHCGAGRADQFERAARLGVTISLPPFQFIYWGDLLDGQMFPTEIGGQWVQAGGAFKTGACVTFHNDGPVSPPLPLLNVQAMVTRRTPSGQVHGPEQQVSMQDAFKAHTVNAAFQMRRDHDLGSITVGKLADLVELSADPFTANPETLTNEVKVLGTWSNGRKVDTAAFLSAVEALDPTPHAAVSATATDHCC